MTTQKSTPATLGELIYRRDFSCNPNHLKENEEMCAQIFASLFHERYEKQRPFLLSYLVMLRLVHNTKCKDFSHRQIELLNIFTIAFCREYAGVPTVQNFSVNKNDANKSDLSKNFTAFWSDIFSKSRINNVPEIFDLALKDFETLLNSWLKRKTLMAVVYNEKSISIILNDMSRIVKGGKEDWKKIRQPASGTSQR